MRTKTEWEELRHRVLKQLGQRSWIWDNNSGGGHHLRFYVSPRRVTEDDFCGRIHRDLALGDDYRISIGNVFIAQIVICEADCGVVYPFGEPGPFDRGRFSVIRMSRRWPSHERLDQRSTEPST
jgi:hypothetical protein